MFARVLNTPLLGEDGHLLYRESLEFFNKMFTGVLFTSHKCTLLLVFFKIALLKKRSRGFEVVKYRIQFLYV